MTFVLILIMWGTGKAATPILGYKDLRACQVSGEQFKAVDPGHLDYVCLNGP